MITMKYKDDGYDWKHGYKYDVGSGMQYWHYLSEDGKIEKGQRDVTKFIQSNLHNCDYKSFIQNSDGSINADNLAAYTAKAGAPQYFDEAYLPCDPLSMHNFLAETTEKVDTLNTAIQRFLVAKKENKTQSEGEIK